MFKSNLPKDSLSVLDRREVEVCYKESSKSSLVLGDISVWSDIAMAWGEGYEVKEEGRRLAKKAKESDLVLEIGSL
jgi:hypothetical protein